jgi:hypothetical protein
VDCNERANDTLLLSVLALCSATQEQQPFTDPDGRPIPSEAPYRITEKVRPPQPVYTPPPSLKSNREGVSVLRCIIGTDGIIQRSMLAHWKQFGNRDSSQRP